MLWCFTSVRQGVTEITDRWGRAAEELGEGDRVYARQVVAMAKRHASEKFYLFDNPLEAVAFSALVELLRDNGEA